MHYWDDGLMVHVCAIDMYLFFSCQTESTQICT
jgi:hypothetical protein